MPLIEKIQKIAGEIPSEITEQKGVYTLKFVIAERKTFLSKKKLEYRAKFRIDEENKEIRFTEMLKESGWGLSSGGGPDFDMSPGLGFKSGTYKVGLGGEREGTIKEQSNLFGKKYDYKLDFGKIRRNVEAVARKEGYKFTYKITRLGL